MSLIKIQIDDVKNSKSELDRIANRLLDTANDVSGLRRSIDYKIRTRRNIDSRLYSTAQSIDELEYKVNKIKKCINFALDKYSNTEEEIVRKASAIQFGKKDNSLLNNILGYFDSINKALSTGDNILVGSLSLSALANVISSSRLKINYIGGKPTLIQKFKGGYKFTVQANKSWLRKGNYSNNIAKLIYNFSKSTPNNLFTKTIHKAVSSYRSPSSILKHAAGFPKNVNGVMKAATLSERIHIRATFGTKETAQTLAKMKGWTGVGKRIPVIGNVISIGANLTEFVDPENAGKTTAEKTGRAFAGVATDIAAISLGAKAGATIGAIGGPVGIVIGGAVGGLVGGVVSSVAGDKIKDVGENIASKLESGAKSLTKSFKSVSSWFN